MAAGKKEEETRGIDETLAALGVSDDSSPVSVEEEENDEDDFEDEEEESDSEEEDEAATSTKVTPLRRGKKTEIDVPLPPPPEDDAGTILVPPPKPPKAKVRTNAPGTTKLGKGLADKVPGAEKVKVYKREKDGKKWFIAEYNKADLSGHTDFESFLTEFVKDEHGAGEYTLMGVDAMNREMEVGVVRLKGSGHQGDSALGLVQQMLAASQKQNAEWIKRMEEGSKQQHQPHPLELLAGVMDLNDRINGNKGADASNGVNAAFKAMADSGDRTMQMMMGMMQMSQQQAQQNMQMMMAMLSRPKEEDPVTKLLLMKLLEDKDSGGGSSLPIPPPPPKESMAEMLTAIAGLMAAMGGGGGEGGDDFKEFLKTMLLKQQQDGLSIKEVIQLVMTEKEKPGTDDFRRSIDNLAAIMNVANNMNRNQEGGPAAGLFDALAALFSNRDFAGSIAQTIRAKTDQSSNIQRTGLTQQQQQLQMQQRLLEQQRQRLLQQEQHIKEMQLQQSVNAPPRQMQQPVQPQQPMQQPVQPQQPQPQPQMEQAPQQTSSSAAKLPELPSETMRHIEAMDTALDDGELIGKLVTMLIYFSEFQDWRPFTETLLTFVRDGNKKKALEYLHAFFSGLASIQVAKPELGERVLRSINEHFDAIRSQLQDLPLVKDQEEGLTGDDLMAEPEQKQ